MFRKVLIFAMFATAAGYCFAAETLPQVVTSEVYYTDQTDVDDDYYATQDDASQFQAAEETVVQQIPTWPIAGSEVDVDVTCDGVRCATTNADNGGIKIVSKIGDDLVVENNFNGQGFGGWSGGANMLHGNQIPVGFDDECNSNAEMPLLHREVLEDDGGNILSVSRSGRKICGNYADGYMNFATQNGMMVNMDGKLVNAEGELVDENGEVISEDTEISVNTVVESGGSRLMADQVRSWVVANGQTLREVLQDWCNKEGWDLVWTTSREYPIEASAVFKGRFVDVASALVRNFGRANPVPYAKFYNGNKVLVISTNEE